MLCVKYHRQPRGFTLVEMLVVIAIMGILAALLLPALSGGKARARRIVCESQLREIGLAFQSFAHDHNSRFPMQVTVSDGGSREYVDPGNLTNGDSYFAYRHFQTLGSALMTPKVLVCPSDTRLPAPTFIALQNSNVSYFVAVNADYNQPMSILAGDGNLAASGVMIHGAVGGRLTWNREQHQYKGNVLFADGHVEEWKDLGATTLAGRTEIVLPLVSVQKHGNSLNAPGALAENSPQSTRSAELAISPGPNGIVETNAPQVLPVTTPQPLPDTLPAMQPTVTFSASGHNGEPGNNAAAENALGTNSAAANLSGPATNTGDDANMSLFDRELAQILRDVIIGAYFLILLLMLLFAAYRLWRWCQSSERRRYRS